MNWNFPGGALEGTYHYDVYVTVGSDGFARSADLGDTATSSRAGALADIDADGDRDLILANASPNTVYVNDGAGSFSLDQSLGSADSQDVAAVDLDGDGTVDLLAFANASPNTVYF